MNRNPISQRALSLLLSFALVLSIFGVDTVGAYAAQNNSIPTKLYLDSGDIVITSTGVTQGGQTVTRGAQDSGYLITQNGNGEVQHSITVQSGTQDITLQNVHAELLSGCAFEVENLAEADITLAGSNSLDTSASGGAAGFAVNAGSTVHISGSGSLTATGGYQSAGIGGNDGNNCGTVEISGGTVTANGGNGGAGIGGGGNGGSGGSVTISGGSVTATGGSESAGIGGGNNGAGGTITVSGGTITANGGNCGAGIGGGQYGAGGTITVSGGTVTANGGQYGAGIGGGIGGIGGIVTISGTDTQVTAKGQNGGKDIGSGDSSSNGGSLAVSDGATVAMTNAGTNASNPSYTDGCHIILNNNGTLIEIVYGGSNPGSRTVLAATLTAKTAANGAVALTASVSPAEAGTFDFAYSGVKDSGTIADNVSIDDITGQATATWDNPPVGGLTVVTAKYKDSGSTYDALKAIFYYDPTIDLSTVSRNGYGYTYNNTSHTITLMDGGKYIFTGSTSGAAANKIAVPSGVSANVTLQDASINVSGTNNVCAFSIAKDAVVNLTLKGSNTLKSGSSCAGLQVPGDGTNPPDTAGNAFLTVTDASTGSLTATGGGSGAGIGGGYDGAGGNIQISGGTVTANGGFGGAGIGGGNGGGGYGNGGGTVAISGPNTEVTAMGQDGGKDIGSGNGKNRGGSLTVGDGNTSEPLPVLELLSAGTNAANPDTSHPQFMNCVIQGAGAKDEKGNNVSGCYDKDGKLWLDITMPTPSTVKVGESVALSASVKRHYFNDTVTLPGTVQFTGSGKLLGSSTVTNGAAQINWTPADGNAVTLKAAYVSKDSNDHYAGKSPEVGYTPGKITPTVSALPTASAVNSGDKLSASSMTGGKMTDANSAAIPGKFAWASPDTVVTASGDYEAIFIPDDTTVYNAVSGIRVPVTVNVPAQKTTPVIQTVPTASPIASGDRLSASKLTGGKMTNANGAEVSGKFAWANPDAVVTASGNYAAVFTPNDTTVYNAVSGIMVPVTLNAPAQKTTPVIQTVPTASPIASGDRLSASTLTGGKMTNANGAEVSGKFAWANPDAVVTASGDYEAIFTPTDTTVYNTVSGISVPVTVTAASSSGSHSSGTSTPSLPTSLTDVPTNTTVILSGAAFPSGVTGVSLSFTPETSAGTPEGVAGGTSDPQAANVFHLVITKAGLNLIGSPFVYNIKLLDQNGNPITSFTGSVTVKIPVPEGIHGTPRVFRYEESTGTFTDMNAAVENGFLVFSTDHFSYYAIAGTGDSITLDTRSYTLPAGGKYQIGVKLTGSKAATVKVYSTNDKTAAVAKLKNGNYQVTGKGSGTAYIMFDVYDNKNHLLTHASVKIDVKTGIRPRGDSERQIGIY